MIVFLVDFVGSGLMSFFNEEGLEMNVTDFTSDIFPIRLFAITILVMYFKTCEKKRGQIPQCKVSRNFFSYL